ncbi:uncharacterized protein LOC135849451 [Planococcus citri]|uniref:uncharacterized protein LOC135849451 n=1 Tax=Planococcus citri TaxID=170843 RepID=UPI0031F8D3F5
MFTLKVLILCLIIPTYECPFSKPREETEEEKVTKGMTDTMAELSHFTRRFGFVDYHSNHLFDIERYLELQGGHSIELESWTPKLWEHFLKQMDDVKFDYCKNTLKDPVLHENAIKFDTDADEELTELVFKEVVFLRYKKMPVWNYLVKCPITIQGKEGYFAYITLFERTKYEKNEDENEKNEDFYFILFDLYYKDTRTFTNQVVTVMRTKLGATVSLPQRFGEFLKNTFLAVKNRIVEG